MNIDIHSVAEFAMVGCFKISIISAMNVNSDAIDNEILDSYLYSSAITIYIPKMAMRLMSSMGYPENISEKTITDKINGNKYDKTESRKKTVRKSKDIENT